MEHSLTWILVGVLSWGMTHGDDARRPAAALLTIRANGKPGERAAIAGQNQQVKAPTVLGIQGARFTLDGKPTFLLGMSYYGALGARQDFLRRDLDDMQRLGFNWLRVWASCNLFDQDISVVDGRVVRANGS